MYKQKISLKARALRFLSMREHSRMELERKLSPYVEETDNLKEILDFLENSKFLSDERFSESLVHRRQARFGNQRILAELHTHGLSQAEIINAKEKLAVSEVSRAVEVLHRKFVEPPSSHIEKAKQMKFLQQRGFSMKAITEAFKVSRDES